MLRKFSGGCHCRAIQFEFYSKTQVDLIKCNCTICTHTNYLHLIIPHKNFYLKEGKDLINTYEFNKNLAKHFFCRVCGIKSFYQPRSHQKSFSINFNSIYNAPKINKIIDFDGKNFEKNIKKIKS